MKKIRIRNLRKQMADRRLSRLRAQKVAWALKQVVIEENTDVLTVGCGDGTALALIHEQTPSGLTCGVDQSERELALARERNLPAIKEGSVRLVKAGAVHLPFDDQYFQLVCVFSCYAHWAQPEANLREVHRVLKNGGTALVTSELEGRQHATFLGETSTTQHRIPAEELRRIMEELGFENVTVETHENWQVVIGGKV